MRSKALPRGQELAELARKQHGVVSVRQLRGLLGYSQASVERAAVAGRLHRIHRGVYSVGHTDVSPHGLCLAAVLSCGPRALLSHWSAAWLWGVLATSPVPHHVTTPLPRKPRPPIRLHHSRTLVDEDRALVAGIPVTSLPRTMLDQACTLGFSRLRRMLQRAEELGLFDLGPVERVLARNAGHAGCGALRRSIELYRPPRFSRSDLERDFLAAVVTAGLPDPMTNWVVLGYELDFYWPDHRFAVELDVFETHGTRESFESDRLRQEDLKLAGIELTRVTGLRLEREPRQVIDRVARLLEQRQRSLET
jgi:Transcriptional regulator, AbiEi antitoxin